MGGGATVSEVWAHVVQPSLGCTAATPPPHTRVVDVSDEPRCRCGNVMEWRGADWFCADCDPPSDGLLRGVMQVDALCRLVGARKSGDQKTAEVAMRMLQAITKNKNKSKKLNDEKTN
jgi:hypothetical protein